MSRLMEKLQELEVMILCETLEEGAQERILEMKDIVMDWK